jgi:hypothetical protein
MSKPPREDAAVHPIESPLDIYVHSRLDSGAESLVGGGGAQTRNL